MSEVQFFVTGGTLRADAESYVLRSADREIHEALSQEEFCYVLTSRQKGKSSLMVRAAGKLREEGVAVVVVDLTALGQNIEIEQWYFGLLGHIGEQVDLEDDLESFWDAHSRLSPLQRWSAAIREVVLERWPGRLVIFVDEIDYVRSLSFSADEFFAAIRECYNRRTQDRELSRLTFCLLGVATPSDLISNTRMTPFNIGRAIELNDFTIREAAVLGAGLRSEPEAASALLRRVMHWTAGHPYLTQRLCKAVAQDASASCSKDVDRICKNVFLCAKARDRDDNLHFVRERMLHSEKDRAALLDLYGRLCRGNHVLDDDLNPLISELKLAGIVRVARGELAVHNRIYAQVFDLKWARANLPDAERERQHAAFVRGMVRTISYATALLVVVSVLAVTAAVSARNARTAKHQAEVQAHIAETQTQIAEAQKRDAERQKQRAEEQASFAKAQLDRANTLAGKIKHAETKANEVLAANQTKLFDALAPALATRSESREMALKLGENLYRGLPDETAREPAIMAGRAKLLRTFSQLYRGLGNTDAALKRAQEALEITRGVALEYPENASWQLDLCDSYNAIGDVCMQKHKFAEAAKEYEQGFEIADQLARNPSGELIVKRQLFACYIKLGDALSRQGTSKEAYTKYAAALDIAQTLRDSNPNGPDDLTAMVCKALDRIGDTFLDENRPADALRIFTKSLEIRLTGGEPVADKQDNLAISYNKIGRTYDEFARDGNGRQNYDKAFEFYQKSLRIREELVKQDGKNPIWQRNLAFSENNIGSVHLNRGEFKLALEHYERRLEIAEQLAADDPSNADWREDLEEAQNHLAYALLSASPRELRDRKRALELAEQSVERSGRSDSRFLKTLAQALFENQRKQDAVLTANEALAISTQATSREIQELLKTFAGRKPADNSAHGNAHH